MNTATNTRRDSAYCSPFLVPRRGPAPVRQAGGMATFTEEASEEKTSFDLWCKNSGTLVRRTLEMQAFCKDLIGSECGVSEG